MKVRTQRRGILRAPDAEGLPAPKGNPARPLTHEEHRQLKEEVHNLFVKYGRNFVIAEVNRRPEKNRKRGHPPKWNITQLLSLWLIVQTFSKQKNKNIEKACEVIEEIGGICHLVLENGMLVEKPTVVRKERIRRLYYDADKLLNTFDIEPHVKFPERAERNKIINGDFKEHLLFIVGAQEVMRVAFSPVLDDVAYFIYAEFYRRGIVRSPPRFLTEIEP